MTKIDKSVIEVSEATCNLCQVRILEFSCKEYARAYVKFREEGYIEQFMPLAKKSRYVVVKKTDSSCIKDYYFDTYREARAFIKRDIKEEKIEEYYDNRYYVCADYFDRADGYCTRPACIYRIVDTRKATRKVEFDCTISPQ